MMKLLLFAALPLVTTPEAAIVPLITTPEPVVCGDQTVIAMSESYWRDLTNKVETCARYTRIAMEDAEKTEAGRVKFHGKRVRVSVNGAEMKRVTFYEDGWSFEESYQPRRSASPAGSAVAAPSDTPSHARPAGLEAAIKRREAAKKAAPVEYTEIHIGGSK